MARAPWMILGTGLITSKLLKLPRWASSNDFHGCATSVSGLTLVPNSQTLEATSSTSAVLSKLFETCKFVKYWKSCPGAEQCQTSD